MTIVEVINASAAVAGVIAGLLWWKASRVEYPEATVIGGFVEGGLSRRDQHALVDALRRSGNMNKWAAVASSAAAFLTALGIVIR